MQARDDCRVGRVHEVYQRRLRHLLPAVEMFDGEIIEVCLRGLTVLPDGGTSAAILAHIEQRIFSYSRAILRYWMEDFEMEHGSGSWAAAGGPDPDNIGLHRLSEDTVLMSDTCHGARCTKRMCARRVHTYRLHFTADHAADSTPPLAGWRRQSWLLYKPR
jgi:hypothetical protein